LVFGSLGTGRIRKSSHQSTYTLEDDGTHARLTITTDEVSSSASSGALDGTEHTWPWQRVSATVYEGERTADGAKTTFRLVAIGDPNDRMELVCQTGQVDALPANAVLIPGDVCERGPRPHWKPPTHSKTSVLSCKGMGEGAVPFGSAPGIEAISENSDCAANEHALRRRPEVLKP